MKGDPRGEIELRYLKLLKQALTFSLWHPPPVPLHRIGHTQPLWRRVLIRLCSRILWLKRIELVRHRKYSSEDIDEGRTWPEYADTMIGLRRLNQLEDAVETILREDVPGDLLEAGAWRGGACIYMRAMLLVYGITDRQVIVADSFKGLPPTDLERFPLDRLYARDRGNDFLAVTLEAVRANFEKYGLLDDQVRFVTGYFEESLPDANIGQLSLLRLDADMYGSTSTALAILYPRLAPGGFCIIDDYDLAECRQAVEDYRARHRITEKFEQIDRNGVYWRKA